MNIKIFTLAVSIIISLAYGNTHAGEQAATYWDQQQSKEILDKTRHVYLDPDTSALTSGEQAAMAQLIEAGHIINSLYEDSMHPEALASKQALLSLQEEGAQRQSLLDLYYMFKGPIASTLDNQRVPFLPVIAEEPGKNVYPAGMSREKNGSTTGSPTCPGDWITGRAQCRT